MVAPPQQVQPYLEQLARLPFVLDVKLLPAERSSAGSDGIIRLTTPTHAVELPIELKRTHLTRAMAEHLVHYGAERPGLLVMAPVVGRTIADTFARHRLNYMDLSGNCFLRLGDQYIANVQGQRAEVRRPAEKALRAPAYRVLFALLADPDLIHAPARRLAELAGGVSPQTATDVRARLLANGVLLKTRGGLRWVPGRRREALDIFLGGFPALMPGFVIGRYRAKQRTPEELEADLAPRLAALGEWRWGGGAGAQRLTGFYRGANTIVYLRDPDVAAIKRLPLVPDAEGEIALVRALGPLAFEGPNPEVVHPLLVYADLLMEGHDRAREAAGEVYRRYLDEART